MTRYILPLILGCLVCVFGFARDGEEGDAPKKEEPPRLKRKKRDGDQAKDPQKDKAKDPEKDKEKKDKAKADEKLQPEDGPGAGEPEEDDKDVLERVSRNMRGVEEKLGNREVGDPTAQQQSDILKDLDSLIRRSQQEQGGGGADQQPQGGQEDQKDDQKQGGQQKQGGGKAGGGKAGGQKQGQRVQRQPRRGQQRTQQAKGGQGKGENKPKPGPGGGKDPGQAIGGDGPRSDKEQDTKTYKDVWGHLPESLRAEMNAYSNPKPFMPRYDDLIKKYYRTIAEQGRKKGN